MTRPINLDIKNPHTPRTKTMVTGKSCWPNWTGPRTT